MQLVMLHTCVSFWWLMQHWLHYSKVALLLALATANTHTFSHMQIHLHTHTHMFTHVHTRAHTHCVHDRYGDKLSKDGGLKLYFKCDTCSEAKKYLSFDQDGRLTGVERKVGD